MDNFRVLPSGGHLLASGQSERVLRVLTEHRGVREAAVLVDAHDVLVAFVVPQDEYLDTVLKRKKLESTSLRRWQKAVDLTQFVKGPDPYSVGLNTQGWNSVYTGREIPRDQMQEWVRVCTADILRLEPKKVYEIGCGTGMLLLQIASACDRYTGVDFSPATLSKLREQLQSFPFLLDKVELIQRRADEFEGLARNSFDTVIINSVIFYFPNLTYLRGVLEKAIEIVEPGGNVFVGDALSLHLLPLLASSIELFMADDQLSVGELRDRVRRRADLQPWLFVSPAFFLSLLEGFPKVSRVEIRPRLGRARNEVTGYRFNALIHVRTGTELMSEVAFEDWTKRELNLDEIRSMIRNRNEAFGIMQIRNLRLDKDLNAFERIRSADSALTVAELKREAASCPAFGIHPQDLVDLCAEMGRFRVELSWAACRPDGSYDAFFYPSSSSRVASAPTVNWPKPAKVDLLTFASWPGQSECRSEFLESIVLHCKQRLPDDLVPVDATLVDALPRKPDGTIETEALLGYRQRRL